MADKIYEFVSKGENIVTLPSRYTPGSVSIIQDEVPHRDITEIDERTIAVDPFIEDGNITTFKYVELDAPADNKDTDDAESICKIVQGSISGSSKNNARLKDNLDDYTMCRLLEVVFSMQEEIASLREIINRKADEQFVADVVRHMILNTKKL